MENFKIKFWGVRGSYPVSEPDKLKIGGHTACTEININDQTIIIDAGTGIINLGNHLIQKHKTDKKPIIATLLFSHMHYDHNQGFPFFKPFYNGNNTLYLYGPGAFETDLEKVIANAMLPPFSPVEFHELNSENIVRSISDFEAIVYRKALNFRPQICNIYQDNYTLGDDDFEVRILKGYAHPKVGILFFKITFKNKSIVYASDTEGYLNGDQRIINFSKYCDVLIHDAQYTNEDYIGTTGYTKQGFGHSTPEMAIEVAKKAFVKKLVLFHHEPEYNDAKIKEIEAESISKFPNTISAYEGLEINLI